MPVQAAYAAQRIVGRMFEITIASAARKTIVARERIVVIDRLSTRLPATVASVLALDPIHDPAMPEPAPMAATSARTQSWMAWA